MGTLSKVFLACSVVFTPSLAFADVAPKCGCSIDGAGVGAGWLLLAGVTALVIRYRRRQP